MRGHHSQTSVTAVYMVSPESHGAGGHGGPPLHSELPTFTIIAMFHVRTTGEAEMACGSELEPRTRPDCGDTEMRGHHTHFRTYNR